MQNSTPEIEIRFNRYKISQRMYERVLHIYKTKYPSVKEERSTIISYSDRRRSIGGESIQKNQLDNYSVIVDDYMFKMVFSSEKNITISSSEKGANRDRIRHSFIIGNSIRFDISMSKTNNNTDYEMEFEWIRSLEDFENITNYTTSLINEYNKALIPFYKILRNVKEIITMTMEDNIYIEFQSIFEPNYLYFGNLPKPRDLIWENYTNFYDKNAKKLIKPTLESSGGYAITVKTDGIRTILYYSSLGVFYMTPRHNANSISWISKIGKPIETMNGTVFDGELYFSEEYYFQTNKYSYFIFDCIATPENFDIRNAIYSSRISAATSVLSNLPTLNNEFSWLKLKIQRIYKHPSKFLRALNNVVNDIKEYRKQGYKDDGIIFTPISKPYYNKKIFKWKPIEKLTIDFKVEGGILKVKSGNSVIPFKPKPFNENFNAPKNNKGESIYEGEIIEMKYKPHKDSFKKGNFVFYKKRNDRPFPNYLSVAENVFKIYRDPISLNDLLQLTSKPVRKYHSNIKSFILHKYSIFGVKNNNIDIGTGKGGDIAKMKIFNKNFVVEPNNVFVTELIKRKTTLGIKNLKIPKTNLKGQDTIKIKKFIGPDKIHTITMMNSLTFFYNPQNNMKDLNQLLNTLDLVEEGGNVVILSADGDKFYEILDKQRNGEFKASNKYTNLKDDFIIKWKTKKNNRIFIKLGTAATLPGQYEWLVDINNFIARMNERKFFIVDDFYLDANHLFGEPWKTFTSSYRFVAFRKTKTSQIMKTVITPIIPKRYIIDFLNIGEMKAIDYRIGGANLYRIGIMSDRNYCIFFVIYELLSQYYRQLEHRFKADFISNELKKLLNLLTENKYFNIDDRKVSEKAYGVINKEKILTNIISNFNINHDEDKLFQNIKIKLKPKDLDNIIKELIVDIIITEHNTSAKFIRNSILTLSNNEIIVKYNGQMS